MARASAGTPPGHRRCGDRLSRQQQNDPVRALRLATATLGLGSLHQKPRVCGAPGGALRDGSDCWRPPVPRAAMLGPKNSTSSANHPEPTENGFASPVRPDGCNSRRVAFVRRCGVPSACCCDSGVFFSSPCPSGNQKCFY